jgi:AraC family transcriptional regulator
MHVTIVNFPETVVAAITHRGAPALEHTTALKLVAWKREHGLLDQSRYRSYGVHYTDPLTTLAAEHRVDFCLSIEGDVSPNPHGIVRTTIPASRCAMVRHVGSRLHNTAAHYLYTEWLPASGESIGAFPMFFHYVNVGPQVQEHDMVTDVYLPLR